MFQSHCLFEEEIYCYVVLAFVIVQKMIRIPTSVQVLRYRMNKILFAVLYSHCLFQENVHCCVFAFVICMPLFVYCILERIKFCLSCFIPIVCYKKRFIVLFWYSLFVQKMLYASVQVFYCRANGICFVIFYYFSIVHFRKRFITMQKE